MYTLLFQSMDVLSIQAWAIVRPSNKECDVLTYLKTHGRSLPSVPGFLLLSLVLFGLKQRTQGKLAAPIGLRSGIMTASYLIQTSGIIQSKPGTPFWMISTYHLHPFDGVIGLSVCALLAILFFPQEPVHKDSFVSWQENKYPQRIASEKDAIISVQNLCEQRTSLVYHFTPRLHVQREAPSYLKKNLRDYADASTLCLSLGHLQCSYS